MDQAWQLEQEFWRCVASGRAAEFYQRHLTADGFVVLPGRTVSREELIIGWGDRAMSRYELSEPRLVLVDGETVLISYEVEADSEWLPDYHARMSAVYSWAGGGWALVFRQHTPVGAATFPL